MVLMSGNEAVARGAREVSRGNLTVEVPPVCVTSTGTLLARFETAVQRMYTS